ELLLYPLESRFPPWDPSRGAPDGIVVLGGSVDTDLSAAHNTPVVPHAADRLFATAELARKYPNARVVFTGGSANLVSDNAKEAD
ncbi:YdcF family protein, partial [Salmonella enterica]|uniref:YdcF family protein n=2 Tax=Pseudomonadota TaxID=1224 RepID=UPI003CEFB9A3